MKDWRERCDWCRWPLHVNPKRGCTPDSCAMRPRPASGGADLRQECRKAEKEVARLRKMVELRQSAIDAFCEENRDSAKIYKDQVYVKVLFDLESKVKEGG